MQKKERNLGICMVVIMVLALVPLYIISGYAHPSVDDYSYGKFASLVWQTTGSVPKVLADAWERTKHTYETWQGTFSSVFLMRLQPAVFGEEYYFLTTAVLLTVFLLCSILFYMAFFVKLFGASFFQGWVLSGMLSLGAVEFTHMISDSFYWYNGGVTYTFFYSMEAFLFALLIFLYCAKSSITKIFLGTVSMLLALFTCGGNYVTSLVTVEILFFACVLVMIRYVWIKKNLQIEEEYKNSAQNEHENKNIIFKWFHDFLKISRPLESSRNARKLDICFFLLIFFMAVAGFLTAILAPGNAVRQAEVGEAMNPLMAIFLSFIYGGYSIGNCINLPVLVLLLACIPLMVFISRRTAYSFCCPGIVTFFSYCLYSSQITPVIYAQGLKIPYRIMNIIYFSCFVMAAVNLFYWIGYFEKKKKIRYVTEKITCFYQKYFIHFYIFCFLLFCFTTAGGISIKAEVDVGGKTQVEVTEMPASISSLYYLMNGEAKQYDKEAWERYEIYSDVSIENAVVSEFSVKPDIIFHSDITESPKNWKNKCVRKYFGKRSVKLKKEE